MQSQKVFISAHSPARASDREVKACTLRCRGHGSGVEERILPVGRFAPGGKSCGGSTLNIKKNCIIYK